MISIAFIGGTQRAVKTLEMIFKDWSKNIKIDFAVFMEGYDDEKMYCEELVKLAKKNNIDFTVSDVITEKIIEKMNFYKPKVIIGGGVWRSMVSKDFFDIPELGYIGLHGTALPEYRGWAGINWQIINGQKEIKTRMFRVDEGIDSGNLVCRKNGCILEYTIDIDNEKHLDEIFDDYLDMHLKAYSDFFEALIDDDITFIAQDETKATYACNRSPEDGEINWDDSTKNIFNFIRAQSKPYQGAYTFYDGKKITLWKVKPRYDYFNYVGRISGKVVTRDKNLNSVVILTNDGGIEIFDVESESKETNILKIFNSVRKRCKSEIENYIELFKQQKIKDT
ncbi:MAG: formyltransferase family protein [Campylobacterota bacterium]|nr:formyltransferase family protein [Campylobacterota bacterium]